ncbi:lasso peptide biosynthesis B2 protein [uncultured Williamsia sp.]|uniref:lasso peptide biosynthesis B2 protein n=1 Tax=uncultured Williamsia sp. TaxID=259311 RepID=UPI003457FE00
MGADRCGDGRVDERDRDFRDRASGSDALNPVRETKARRFGPANIAAAVWTAVTYPIVQRRLKRDGVRTRCPSAPHRLPSAASRGMEAVLRRTRATCLESALIRQEWWRAHDRPVEVVIGVDASDGFTAHAWLSTDDPKVTAVYREIHRVPSRLKGPV